MGTVVLVCWLGQHWGGCNYLAMGAVLLGGYPIFEEAFVNLRQRRMTMELSMSIALFAALAIGENFTALLITFFVLIAEALEKLTMGRGRGAIEELLSLLPQEAFVREGDRVEERKLSVVHPGDIVVIKPGARVPVDGLVVAGHSFIDQSTITGESMPVEKMSGAVVYAGTINQSGSIDVKTTEVGQDTAFGKIIYAVEQAERYQAPVEKTADRLAGYLVYFALACAILTFLVTHNVKATISVVIVAGACGIAAGTPLAILGGIGLSARAGSIIKGGIFLELLSAIDTVVFDKTGTLTCGTPQVIDVVGLGSSSKEEVLSLAACAESLSEHPLGRAIVQYFFCGQTDQSQSGPAGLEELEKNIFATRPENFVYLPGQGISCTIDGAEVAAGSRALFAAKNYDTSMLPAERNDASEVVVGRDKLVLGVVYLADLLRPEARQAVADLSAMGIKSVLLTGDARPIAESIAAQLQIQEVAAAVLPAGKQAYIKEQAAAGRRVAMVGDGVNDAPALMEASVGVAVGSGTDVARESADVVLIGNDLGRFVETVRIARRCKRIIMTNFIGTLAVDGLGVLLAAIGCQLKD
jgi:Cd2+/Zn2+-exporting ATPase/Cu+-exporting ATPase